jgi:alkylhydroperoxidase family enzyme
MKGFIGKGLLGAIGVFCCCALSWGAEPEGGKPAPVKGRVPYANEDQPGQEDLVRAMRARRPGGKLLNLDRMRLNSPPLAGGWNARIGAVRTQLEVPPRLRELAIMAIAVVNGADYESIQHRPEFLAAGGTEDQLGGLADVRAACDDAKRFSEEERATLLLAYEMTRDVAVAESTITRLLKILPARQVVELVGTVAAYNMVSRFLIALGVEPE